MDQSLSFFFHSQTLLLLTPSFLFVTHSLFSIIILVVALYLELLYRLIENLIWKLSLLNSGNMMKMKGLNLLVEDDLYKRNNAIKFVVIQLHRFIYLISVNLFLRKIIVYSPVVFLLNWWTTIAKEHNLPYYLTHS